MPRLRDCRDCFHAKVLPGEWVVCVAGHWTNRHGVKTRETLRSFNDGVKLQAESCADFNRHDHRIQPAGPARLKTIGAA